MSAVSHSISSIFGKGIFAQPLQVWNLFIYLFCSYLVSSIFYNRSTHRKINILRTNYLVPVFVIRFLTYRYSCLIGSNYSQDPLCIAIDNCNISNFNYICSFFFVNLIYSFFSDAEKGKWTRLINSFCFFGTLFYFIKKKKSLFFIFIC